MPPMTMLGWFHTIMGVIAILTAAYTLYRHRIIRASDKLGRAYLVITLVVAGSALAIYNQGGFGVGHILAVLTLTALVVGYLLETLAPFGNALKLIYKTPGIDGLPSSGWIKRNISQLTKLIQSEIPNLRETTLQLRQIQETSETEEKSVDK